LREEQHVFVEEEEEEEEEEELEDTAKLRHRVEVVEAKEGRDIEARDERDDVETPVLLRSLAILITWFKGNLDAIFFFFFVDTRVTHSRALSLKIPLNQEVCNFGDQQLYFNNNNNNVDRS